MIIRGRRAAHILTGVAVLAAIYAISALLKLRLLSAILASVAPYAPFAIIVMFQSEIRRLLGRIGRQRLPVGGRLQRREFTDELVLALTQLASEKDRGPGGYRARHRTPHLHGERRPARRHLVKRSPDGHLRDHQFPPRWGGDRPE